MNSNVGNLYGHGGQYGDAAEFVPAAGPNPATYDRGDVGDYGQNPVGDTQTGFPAQYGSWNFSGAIVQKAVRFVVSTFSLRSRSAAINAGAVYRSNSKRQGGVLPNDSGLLPTYGYLGTRKAPFRGVLFALTPVQIPSQTILSQWGATPEGYTGDTPTDLQQSVQNAPPWRRAAARGDSRGSFRSGIMRGLRV